MTENGKRKTANDGKARSKMTKRIRLTRALPLLLVVLTACTGSRAFREARDQEALQHWDLAVLQYSRAAELDPKNNRYRMSLARAKIKASQFHFEKGTM